MAGTVLDGIKRWVPLINAEFGRSDRDGYTIEYFASLIGRAYFWSDDDCYLVALPAPDMWGDITLCLLSFGVISEKRNNPVYLRRIMRQAGVFAKLSGARYIEIGSHKGGKIYDLLAKHGFTVCGMKKEL